MPAARYWRLNGIATLNEGDLELSEVAMYDGGSRVDDLATISSSIAPISGALVDLSDTDFDTTVRWSSADLFAAGFAIVWDFGAPQDITDFGVAGPALNSFAHQFLVEYSADGVVWTAYESVPLGSLWTDATTIFKLSERGDQLQKMVELLLLGIGANNSTTIVDSSLFPKTVTAHGAARISTAVSKHGGSSLLFDALGSYVRVPANSAINFAALEWTLEADLFMPTLPAAGTAYIYASRWSNTPGQRQVFFAITSPSTGVYNFNLGVTYDGTTQVNNTRAITISASTHHHIEVVNSGLTVKIFVDGVQAGADLTLSGTIAPAASASFVMGLTAEDAIGNQYLGYIENCRFTNAVRHWANFTPPTNEPVTGGVDVTPYRVGISQSLSSLVENALGVEVLTCVGERAPSHIDLEDGGNYRVVGTVKEVALPSNTPLARRVRLAYDDNGRVFRESFSDAAGNYAFENIRGDRPLVVIAYDHTGIYRAVAADKLTAEPMP